MCLLRLQSYRLPSVCPSAAGSALRTTFVRRCGTITQFYLGTGKFDEFSLISLRARLPLLHMLCHAVAQDAFSAQHLLYFKHGGLKLLCKAHLATVILLGVAASTSGLLLLEGGLLLIAG